MVNSPKETTIFPPPAGVHRGELFIEAWGSLPLFSCLSRPESPRQSGGLRLPAVGGLEFRHPGTIIMARTTGWGMANGVLPQTRQSEVRVTERTVPATNGARECQVDT